MKNIKIVKLEKIIYLLVLIFLMACGKEDEGTIISNDLRILTVTSNGEKLRGGTTDVDNKGLIVEIVFSHSLNITAFENSLSITGSPGFLISYDETNSFVTLTFDKLEFDKNYTINIPAGNYGAKEEELKNDFSLTFTTKSFIAPNITLSATPTGLLEGESATLTATLNKATINDVTAKVELEGTAMGNGMDYTLSATTITIPKGDTSFSITIMAVADAEIEGEETLKITISEVQGAVEDSPQEINITINDGASSLILKGIMALRWATEPSGSSGKAVHLKAMENITDLSVYSLGIANNGGGTDGIEFNLPSISVTEGEDILVARDPSALETYFGTGCFLEFEHVIQTDEMSQNGDGAIELYKGTAVIETYGDANVDGTGQIWEYKGSWAYKLGEKWITAPPGCTEGSTSTMGSDCVYPLCDKPLILKGIMALRWETEPGGSSGKAVHLFANKNIEDLSLYSIGVANNGGGTDGIEYTFPSVSVSAGDHILLAREPNALASYYGACFNGFDLVFQADAMNQNGDGAIELFKGSEVIETYGDANEDGTGQPWEYKGSWAYKIASKWTYGGVDCADGSTSTQNSNCAYPFCE